jgi:D-alanyl-lipoteichoic acid acyltransferase DltB (MBOAT superfamily)
VDPHLHVAATLVLAAIYPLLPVAGRRLLLLVASYVYYASISVSFVPILVAVTLVSFLGGLWVEARRSSPWGAATLTIVALLLPLLFYKYWEAWFGAYILPGVPVSSLSFGGYASVLIPVGLSFYTFQAIGYVVDVARGADAADRNVLRFFLFKAFFPQLLAGPIERYRTLCPQLWQAPIPRLAGIAPALLMLMYGLFLKTCIGDRLGVAVDEAYLSDAPGWRDALMVTIGFTLQVFADFAGYSLIAVGSGKLFGVDLTMNFKQPFFSHNLIEFWQRWHISLTRWIGDYLYRPLGRVMWRWTDGRRNLAEFGTALVVWVVMGLWHGPTAQFVLFGVLQALAMQAIKLSGPDRPALLTTQRLAGGMVATFLFVALTFGLIRTPDLAHYGGMLAALVTFSPGQAKIVEPTLIVIGLVIMIFVEARERFATPVADALSQPACYALAILLFLVTNLFGYDQSRAFVYFRF